MSDTHNKLQYGNNYDQLPLKNIGLSWTSIIFLFLALTGTLAQHTYLSVLSAYLICRISLCACAHGVKSEISLDTGRALCSQTSSLFRLVLLCFVTCTGTETWKCSWAQHDRVWFVSLDSEKFLALRRDEGTFVFYRFELVAHPISRPIYFLHFDIIVVRLFNYPQFFYLQSTVLI